MKAKYLLPIIAATLIMSGCSSTISSIDESYSGDAASTAESSAEAASEASSEASTEAFSEASTEASSEAASEVSSDASSEKAVALSDSECTEIADLFNSKKYNGFLDNEFKSPEEIDWKSVLRLGADIKTQDISDAEKKEYVDSLKLGEFSKFMTVMVIKKADIADFVKAHSGLDYVPEASEIGWDYNEENDCYYGSYYEAEVVGYKCISGEKAGDKYTVTMQIDPMKCIGAAPTEISDLTVKFTKSGDELVMESFEKK
ncbi:hypothetical protein [Butyrivibrio sp. X503]|uniref:hypothetical protein n=1 Tax=Butyrivibrio sp. X503 TaxID=2364878 RepID=UPI001314B118|nr:hypothetical protein [Butyrivibrio sp. X503]